MSSKTTESIFELIHSLTKSEKRYFKLLSSRHTIGDENNYVVLFDYIDKQTEYNEEALFEHFADEAFLNKFSITKKRLYDHILNALTNYHANHHIEAQIFRMIHSSEILFEKSLYDQAKKILRSAEKLAIKHQLTNSILEIRKKGKKLLEKNNYFDLDKSDLVDIHLQDMEFHLQSQYEDELWMHKSRIFQSLSRQGVTRTEEDKMQYDQVFQSFQFLQKPTQKTFEAEYLENHIKSAYYFAVHDLNQSYRALKENKELFANSEVQIKDHPDRYFSILTNLIYTADKLGDYDLSMVYLSELRKLQQSIGQDAESDLRIKLFATLTSIELSFYTKRGDFEEIRLKLPEMEREIETNLENITTLRKAFLYFKIATVYLAFNDPNTALKSLRKLLNDTSLDKKEDIVAFAHLMEILIHLELGNKDMIPYLVKGTQRFLKSRNRLYPFEQEILTFATKFGTAKNRFEQEERWQNLHERLIAFESDKNHQLALEYFDFKTWSEAKIRGVSFIQLIKDKFSKSLKPAA